MVNSYNCEQIAKALLSAHYFDSVADNIYSFSDEWIEKNIELPLDSYPGNIQKGIEPTKENHEIISFIEFEKKVKKIYQGKPKEIEKTLEKSFYISPDVFKDSKFLEFLTTIIPLPTLKEESMVLLCMSKYALDSLIYYSEKTRDLWQLLQIISYYFLIIYRIETLLPPKTKQKQFFDILKENTYLFLNRILSYNIKNPITGNILDILIIFQSCLSLHASTSYYFFVESKYQCSKLSEKQIKFLGLRYARYFKEFYKFKGKLPESIETEIKKQKKNRSLYTISNFVWMEIQHITPESFSFYNTQNKTDLYNFLNSCRYPKTRKYCDSMLKNTGRSLKGFLEYFKNCNGILSEPYYLILDEDFKKFYLNPIEEIPKKLKEGISLTAILCLHFASLDTLAYWLRKSARFPARAPLNDFSVGYYIFCSYLHLVFIEELLDSLREQRQLLIITRKSVHDLLDLMLKKEMISITVTKFSEETVILTKFSKERDPVRDFFQCHFDRLTVFGPKLPYGNLTLLDQKFNRYCGQFHAIFDKKP